MLAGPGQNKCATLCAESVYPFQALRFYVKKPPRGADVAFDTCRMQVKKESMKKTPWFVFFA